MFQVNGKIGLQMLVLHPLSESETHAGERCQKRRNGRTEVETSQKKAKAQVLRVWVNEIADTASYQSTLYKNEHPARTL